MRYDRRAIVIVSDAEVEEARALVAGELGPIDGGDWFTVDLHDASGKLYHASSSVLTQENVGTIVYYQSTPNALTTLTYVASDAITSYVTDTNHASVALGAPFSFDALLTVLGLTRVVEGVE